MIKQYLAIMCRYEQRM